GGGGAGGIQTVGLGYLVGMGGALWRGPNQASGTDELRGAQEAAHFDRLARFGAGEASRNARRDGYEGEDEMVGNCGRPDGPARQLDRTRKLGGLEEALSADLRLREQAQRIDQGHLQAPEEPLREGVEALPRL